MRPSQAAAPLPAAHAGHAMAAHLLLDLDGTLLGLRMEEFVPRMVSSMADHFRGALPPERFVEALQSGYRAMLANDDPSRTLLEAFRRAFGAASGLGDGEAEDLFRDYYLGPFRRLRALSRPVPGLEDFLAGVRRLGIGLVLATKPIFPRAAIAERLAWAGLEAGFFELVTDAETMHYCKPSPSYFLEVAAIVGAAPGECLMAGNDIEQDLAAAAAGMPAFLVDVGYLAGARRAAQPCGEGTLADLGAFLASRPGRRRPAASGRSGDPA